MPTDPLAIPDSYDVPEDEVWVSSNYHYLEPNGETCPGVFTYVHGDGQARCSQCGAWTGIAAPDQLWLVKTKKLDPPLQGNSERDIWNRSHPEFWPPQPPPLV